MSISAKSAHNTYENLEDYSKQKLLAQLHTLLDECKSTYEVLFIEFHPVYTTHLIERFNVLRKQALSMFPGEDIFNDFPPLDTRYGGMDKAEWQLPRIKLAVASLIAFLESETLWKEHEVLKSRYTTLKMQFDSIEKVR